MRHAVPRNRHSPTRRSAVNSDDADGLPNQRTWLDITDGRPVSAQKVIVDR